MRHVKYFLIGCVPMGLFTGLCFLIDSYQKIAGYTVLGIIILFCTYAMGVSLYKGG